MNVPFFDLKRQYASIKDEVDKAVRAVFDNTAFILGPSVSEFERGFAEYLGAEHAIGVNSGTSALHLALKAVGVGNGSEVITTPLTFIATAEAIVMSGAKPVFVDVDKDSLNIDPQQVEAAVSEYTKAIIPVHLYGQVADMDPIMEIARKHKLAVIEDACQAHGAEYKGRKAGVIGDVSAFSFYPSKNLGAYGEGGMVVTRDAEIAARVKALRNHGQNKKDNHKWVGYNYRMSGIQGAVLKTKLAHLDGWTEKRREIAALYSELLAGVSYVDVPREAVPGKHVYHLYVIRTRRRNELKEFLEQEGVQTRIHYPRCLHLQEAFEFLSYRPGDFPVAEEAVDEILSLPMFPELTRDEVEYVANSIKKFYRK